MLSALGLIQGNLSCFGATWFYFRVFKCREMRVFCAIFWGLNIHLCYSLRFFHLCCVFCLSSSPILAKNNSRRWVIPPLQCTAAWALPHPAPPRPSLIRWRSLEDMLQLLSSRAINHNRGWSDEDPLSPRSLVCPLRPWCFFEPQASLKPWPASVNFGLHWYKTSSQSLVDAIATQ